MAQQFNTTPTSSNPYVAHNINNMNLILIFNREKKDWTKKYHHIIQGSERMMDIQLQIQNLANIANIELVDIETTLLQARNSHKEQIGGNIYSIADDL